MAAQYEGLIDALVIDEADADGEAGVRTIVTRTLMDGADGPPPRRRGRARARGGVAMKVAIIGGTGSFGRALAGRLRLLGEDVYIGSRDAERAREKALELGVEGGTNEDVVRGADLVVLATRSNAALETAADPLGRDRRDARALRRQRSALHRDRDRPGPGGGLAGRERRQA